MSMLPLLRVDRIPHKFRGPLPKPWKCLAVSVSDCSGHAKRYLATTSEVQGGRKDSRWPVALRRRCW